MAEIGAYEAKTRLAELLKRVESGERITITRHGRPVAELVPVSGAAEMTVEEAIREMEAFPKVSLGGLRIRDLIEEGRS
jgi:prevent-host-death family protein